MVLRSGAAIRQPQHQQRRTHRTHGARISQTLPAAGDNKENQPPQLPPFNNKMNDRISPSPSPVVDKKKDVPSQSNPSANDDEEDEPLVRKRRHLADSPPQQPPASRSIVEAVELGPSPPDTPIVPHTVRQESMMHTLWFSPPLRKEQTNQQRQQPLNRQQQQSIHLDQPKQFAPRPSSISPKILASIPLRPATSVSPLSPSKDVKGKAKASQSQHSNISPTSLPPERSNSPPSDPEDHKGYWRSPINRSIKKWVIKNNNLARAMIPSEAKSSEAKSSGGINKVYEEAAEFVKERRNVPNEIVDGHLVRKRLEYMVKKVKNVRRETTSTGSGTKDGVTLQQQREAKFPGYHELWGRMRDIPKFNPTETQDSLPPLNLANVERAESEGICLPKVTVLFQSFNVISVVKK